MSAICGLMCRSRTALARCCCRSAWNIAMQGAVEVTNSLHCCYFA